MRYNVLKLEENYWPQQSVNFLVFSIFLKDDQEVDPRNKSDCNDSRINTTIAEQTGYIIRYHQYLKKT